MEEAPSEDLVGIVLVAEPVFLLLERRCKPQTVTFDHESPALALLRKLGREDRAIKAFPTVADDQTHRLVADSVFLAAVADLNHQRLVCVIGTRPRPSAERSLAVGR
jgi:hypothetical protein